MADLIFCLAFLWLQVSLEERLAQHGIASTTASARKGIFSGQHDEDHTSLFNPTFMDDLAVFVEGNTPESMLDKLSTALQVVKEVCEENALTLNRPLCSSGATRPRRRNVVCTLRSRRVQLSWRRHGVEWWATTITWAAESTAPVPRTRRKRPDAQQVRQPQRLCRIHFSATWQSRQGSGRMWRGRQFTTDFSTRLATTGNRLRARYVAPLRRILGARDLQDAPLRGAADAQGSDRDLASRP